TGVSVEVRIFRPQAKQARSCGTWFVLLALLLRFAIPTGFMLSAEGGLAIVPCPTVLPAPASAVEPHHEPHADHHDHASASPHHAAQQHGALGSDDLGHDDRPCPYGT